MNEFGFSFDSADMDKLGLFSIDGVSRTFVVIWVESRDDKRFWNACLPRLSDVQYDFKIADEFHGADEKSGNGCKRLISLQRSGDIVLGKNMIFCLDGDDSFLRSLALGREPDQHPHIYYTNIYSIENAFLHHDLLDGMFEAVTASSGGNISCLPSRFLAKVSSVLHRSILLIAFCGAFMDRKKVVGRRGEFYKAIAATGGCDLSEESGLVEVLSKLELDLAPINSGLLQEVYDQGLDSVFSEFLKSAESRSIDRERCHLFVRGHDLFDMLVRVVDSASNKARHAEVQRVSAIHAGSGKAIKDAIATIRNEWQSYGVALRYGFYASIPEVPFLKESLSRFKADYAPD
ncbi:DUF4435 domain-containing protein [Pseudomonas mosselii]|uniref:DUF4435 domain-containing protein n=1 Tax=Pseudomonas mosselii TaxID=78327 RepID=UPI001FF992A7|nr:DUF4435 domain-containing protein [Pseudomonas mosselii]UPF02926.1 DUF4435 domain-containing protein [Pseudomonas mosselii]